jgi:hypothetical protein
MNMMCPNWILCHIDVYLDMSILSIGMDIDHFIQDGQTKFFC